MNEIQKFYDDFNPKLIKDYVLGNPRIESAISSVLNFFDLKSYDVLDIGCGLGWSTYEFSKQAHSVVGIDLSKTLIKTASRLFSSGNLSYAQVDVTESELIFDKKFDLIVMLDVFEHIDESFRSEFIDSLSKLLKPSGFLFLSCPSVHHQNWLRKNNPNGLQPVDEDIDFQVLINVSVQLKAEVVHYSYQSIWNPNDYFHAVIQKAPIQFVKKDISFKLDPLKVRWKRFLQLNQEARLFSVDEIKRLKKAQNRIKKQLLKSRIKSLIGK